MSKVNEYIDKILAAKSQLILEKAIDDIVNICCDRTLATKDTSDRAHERLCFNNLPELIRNMAMERLEKEDYFK